MWAQPACPHAGASARYKYHGDHSQPSRTHFGGRSQLRQPGEPGHSASRRVPPGTRSPSSRVRRRPNGCGVGPPESVTRLAVGNLILLRANRDSGTVARSSAHDGPHGTQQARRRGRSDWQGWESTPGKVRYWQGEAAVRENPGVSLRYDDSQSMRPLRARAYRVPLPPSTTLGM